MRAFAIFIDRNNCYPFKICGSSAENSSYNNISSSGSNSIANISNISHNNKGFIHSRANNRFKTPTTSVNTTTASHVYTYTL